MMGTKLGLAATEFLLAGERGKMVGMVSGEIKLSQFEKSTQSLQDVVVKLEDLVRQLT